MGTLNEDLSAIKEVEDKIIANKVARFAYTEEAYTTNDANGVAEYDVSKEQNIPTADASVLKVNETVLSKGYRAQASSVTRMLLNHFFGRMSYNLNKVNDIVSNLITTLIGHRGTANGFATLDENGRIPYSQLPESAMEYKGQWNAETNTPALADGTGTKGDFYIVSVGGTQNLGSGNIQFFVNDRVIYDGSVWSRLSAGDVKTVNSVLPTNGNVTLTGENIPVSSTDPTLLSAPLTTDRFADSSVTNAKIKDPISVDKGGTGATDAKNGFKNLANGLTQSQNPQDTEYMIYKSSGNWGLYTLLQFWEYIKGKISSVLGLTKDNYGGKASTAGTADKVANALTVNGKTYDGSEAVDAGVQKIENGGTGVTTQADINEAFIGALNVGNDDVTDGTMFVSSWASNDGFADTSAVDVPFKRKFLTVWNYIKGKISSVLGLTKDTYGGKSAKSSFLDEYPGAGSTRLTSLNIIPKDASEYGGMRKDVVTDSVTDGTHPGQDGHLLTMFWDNTGRYDSQLFISNSAPQTIKSRYKSNRTDYGPWVDVITSNNIGSQTVSNADSATIANMVRVHTCSTHYETKEKTVSIPRFTLTRGVCIRVLFLNGNSVARPTLNVNGTGAKEICGPYGELLNSIVTPPNISANGQGICSWDHKIVLDLYYNGTEWRVIGDPIVMRFSENSTVHKNISMLGNLQTSILQY